ncbi:uncharacterized protein LOC131858824 [Cryptomeria japonica]|uniref:uncharacterized protein LOC131858824 n=1 Tax=Cryptomeria japonica TaxID=3369 RepID=UPI0027DA6859|nr:uncharacterized protein LOC131858824 [Cryptomeria japonica]
MGSGGHGRIGSGRRGRAPAAAQGEGGRQAQGEGGRQAQGKVGEWRSWAAQRSGGQRSYRRRGWRRATGGGVGASGCYGDGKGCRRGLGRSCSSGANEGQGWRASAAPEAGKRRGPGSY